MDEVALKFSLSPIGARTFPRLIKIYGSAKSAWNEADREQFKNAGIRDSSYTKFEKFKNEFDYNDYLLRLKKARVDFISQFDKEYPDQTYKNSKIHQLDYLQKEIKVCSRIIIALELLVVGK